MTVPRGNGRLVPAGAAPERGAVAVEFALLLPILLLILFGIIDFGRAFNAQITLTQAAREGVRAYAITGNPSDGNARTQQAVQGTSLQGAGVGTSTTACTTGSPTTLTATTQFSYVTPVSGILNLLGAASLTNPITLTSKATMRCKG